MFRQSYAMTIRSLFLTLLDCPFFLVPFTTSSCHLLFDVILETPHFTGTITQGNTIMELKCFLEGIRREIYIQEWKGGKPLGTLLHYPYFSRMAELAPIRITKWGWVFLKKDPRSAEWKKTLRGCCHGSKKPLTSAPQSDVNSRGWALLQTFS